MKRVIKIGKELVPVSEEIYREYYKMKRRERYMESDIKAGSIDVDMDNEKVTFVESKEDSIERLIDQGVDIAGKQDIEDIICDKAMLLILQEAMAELNREEQEVIKAIYYQKQTTREIAEQKNVSQPLIVKRHKKALDKLKNFFCKTGYQTTLPVGYIVKGIFLKRGGEIDDSSSKRKRQSY